MFTRWIATGLVLAMALSALPGRVSAQEIIVEGSDTVIGLHRDELTVKIEEAILKGCIYLRDNQSRDGSWCPPDDIEGQDRMTGATGVILMGLLYSGVNTDSPTILRGLNYLARHQEDCNNTYSRGAILCTLALSDPHRKNKLATKLMERQILWLLKAQSNSHEDLWRYGLNSKDHDMSCVQFAVEGLRMAESVGYQIPHKPLAKARAAIWKFQHQGGGWAYTKSTKDKVQKPKLSMTAATTASLSFLDAALSRPREGKVRRDPHIDGGLRALAKMYSATTQHYNAYSIERAGILTGTRFIGGHDWYREIAPKMLARQNEDGSFHAYHSHVGKHTTALGTGFTLLFLGKGLAPTIVGKLDWGAPSRATAYDMRNLTEAVSRELGTHLNWINLPVDAPDEEYMKVPLIYISGDEDPYDSLIEHKAKFVKYLNAGGTILGTGLDNSKEFEDGYTKFVKEIQPGAEFERLPLKHYIYDRWHKIRRTYGLYATVSDKGGRPVALLIKEPFAAPLSTRRGKGVKQSFELGANIILALTNVDKKRNFLGEAMK